MAYQFDQLDIRALFDDICRIVGTNLLSCMHRESLTSS